MSEPNERIELAPGLFMEPRPDGLRLALGGESVDLSPDEGLEAARALVEASAAAGGPPEEQDWHRVPMQYLILAIDPDPEAGPDADEPPPVEVHCWIKEQTRNNAVHVAIGSVVEDGYSVTDLVEQRTVTRADFEGTELLTYYEQALTDDEVFLYVSEDDEPPADGP